MEYNVNIKSIKNITHDVIQIVTEKPPQYIFAPGQATDVSINRDGWKDELRPFTFTCLPADDYLEFTIKTYPSHKSVTNELLRLKKGDGLILHDVFGEIAYKGEGIFIAGGAGITPFISILRWLKSKNEIGNNKLIFANKTKADIINGQEFNNLLNKNFINILSDEESGEYAHGYISPDFLKKYIPGTNIYFYLCGPPPMMDAVEKHLHSLQVDPEFIVKEGF